MTAGRCNCCASAAGALGLGRSASAGDTASSSHQLPPLSELFLSIRCRACGQAHWIQHGAVTWCLAPPDASVRPTESARSPQCADTLDCSLGQSGCHPRHYLMCCHGLDAPKTKSSATMTTPTTGPPHRRSSFCPQVV
eukprot:CAMPEP_0180517714 /NCGR_PEP_ID=MMETSP1036_2-20121128/54684_1 /TAXON_ID=632150 /ORGANISM="Azadinium spinosum, Strain 3D9" /LENGTH=137 /DNA_ID=CAMNT_0022529769 /DNA_START=389 /DNA_END=800 /DNA_ORIENTATION=+